MLVNYPLNILIVWLLLDVLHLKNPILIGTCSSFLFMIAAYIRVFIILYRDEQKFLEKDC